MALNDQHAFKGWGENQRVMLHDKTRFLTLSSVEKWFPRAWMKLDEANDGGCERQKCKVRKPNG